MPDFDGADMLIVVPCLNEEAYLPALLAKLLRNVGGALVVEIGRAHV